MGFVFFVVLVGALTYGVVGQKAGGEWGTVAALTIFSALWFARWPAFKLTKKEGNK